MPSEGTFNVHLVYEPAKQEISFHINEISSRELSEVKESVVNRLKQELEEIYNKQKWSEKIREKMSPYDFKERTPQVVFVGLVYCEVSFTSKNEIREIYIDKRVQMKPTDDIEVNSSPNDL